jgi:hypothetical protein
MFLCLHIIWLSEVVSSEWGCLTQRRTCYTSGHSPNVTVDLEFLNLHIREFADSDTSLGICLVSDGHRGLTQPSGKCGIETQNNPTPLPSILYTINCSLTFWHFPGRLNQSYHSVYTNTFFNSSRYNLNHHHAAFYILYGLCIHTCLDLWSEETSYRCSV